MNDTVAHGNDIGLNDQDASAFGGILAEARRVWRRIGVRRSDRQAMLSELEDELRSASLDGYGTEAILGDDRPEMLRQWAHERGVSGKTLRLHLVLPAAFIGITLGLAVILCALYLAFSGRTNFDPGSLILPLYASAGILAYLCALLLVGGVLAVAGDSQVKTTVQWLAALLPVGAAVSLGVGVGMAWLMDFTTSTTAFVSIPAAVIVCLGLTIGLARSAAIRKKGDLSGEVA